MMLRPTIITLLMFCCLTAHATDNDIALQDNHPDRYVVVKGDTLWGIATKFLKDPWQIWKINKAEIKNPHELHPGDVIMFDASDKKPETQAPASAPSTAPNAPTEAKAAETPNNPNTNNATTNKQTDRYVVTQGDTLMSIASKFLKDPWEVWKINQKEIINPHQIYPGDVIVLDLNNGKPQLRVLPQTVKSSPEATAPAEGTASSEVILSPEVRIEALEREAIPTISPQVIAPFLNKPLLIEVHQLDNAPTIIAGGENRVLFSHGDKVYIDQIKKTQGLQWYIYRVGNRLIDPDSKQTLGLEARYLGDAKIIKYGEPATAEVTRAKEEIFSDDKLIEAREEVQTNLVPHTPENKVTGKILSIDGGLTETGSNRVVTINLGKKDGLEEGHVLSIQHIGRYLKRKPKNNSANNANLIKLPNERVGLLMVFRTFEHVAYALVMQASEPISKEDLVETPE